MSRAQIREYISADEYQAHALRHTLIEGKTAIQSYRIVKLGTYGRAMIIDDRVQSTEADEYIYHESLIYPAFTLHRALHRVACLGGVNGGMLRELRKLPGLSRVVL